MKIYDARELGGFPYSPPEIQCKASDECHGAGSQAPPPPTIKTIAGAPVGNADGSSQRCKVASSKSVVTALRRRAQDPSRHHRKRTQTMARLLAMILSRAKVAGSRASNRWPPSLGSASQRTLAHRCIFAGLLCSGGLLSLTVAASRSGDGGNRILFDHRLDHPGRRPPRSFDLLHPGKPGEPEAAQNVIFNAPQGVFGNPDAITHCTSSDFALDQCPSNSQAGLITVYANYEGNSDYLLGTAPIFDLEPQADRRRFLPSSLPTLNIPITIPVAVRTDADYGLRFTVSGHHSGNPAGWRQNDVLGFSGRGKPQRRTISKRDPW